MLRSSFLCVAATAAFLPAQSTIVSPVGAAMTEGSNANLFPFTSNTARRYMQIHSDIGGVPRNISALKFRLNAGTTTYTTTRTIDMELFMGHGVPALSPSYTFDNNYLAPKTLVLARTNVNFGPQGTAITPGPNPFTANMDILLPSAFPYSGASSLIWEAVVYSVAGAGTFGTPDADASTTTSGTSTITGTGCVATGQTSAMTHTPSFADVGGTLVLNFSVAAGPASAPSFLALGISNPNLPLPGLCSALLTDLTVVLPIGTTSATGTITTATPTLTTFVLPNTIAGGTLFSQVHAVDAGRPDPIPVTNSNGRQLTIPTSNLGRVDQVTRLFNNAGGTTATESIFFATSTVGYALVTEFTY